MNALFVFIVSLFGTAQNSIPLPEISPPHSHTSYKKISISDSVENEVSSPGLSLNQNYKLSSEDSLLEISNVTYAGGTNRARYLQIRGQGETSSYENTPSHSVSYMIDNIDLTGIIASWPQMNIAKQNVVKGPQSTEWGGFASAGILTTELQGHTAPENAQVSLESQNAHQLGVVTNIGSQSRIFIYKNTDPGFYKNSYLNTNGAARDEYYVSLKNEFMNSDNLKISSTHLGFLNNNNYDVWTLNNSTKTISDQPGEDSAAVHGHSLSIEKKLTESLTLSSLSSVTFSQSIYSYDADWGNNAYWLKIPQWNLPYDYFDSFERQRLAWHQKLIIKKNVSSAGIHLYGLQEESEVRHYKNKLFKEGLDSEFHSTSAAFFTDTSIPTDDNSFLQIAARYEIQNQHYRDTLLTQVSQTEPLVAVKTSWVQNLSQDLSFKALISHGFKSPGVNIDSALSEGQRFYGAERVTNYEVGLSSLTPSRSLSANLFYTDSRDKQVRVSQQSDPTDPSSFTYFTNNAGRASSLGLEAQSLFVFKSWKVQTQIGLLKAQFRDYAFENQSLRGRDLAHAPSWNYSTSVTKNWNSRFLSNITFLGKNSFSFSNNHNLRSQQYHLVDIGSSYTLDRWSLHAWIKNIFDESYQTRGFFFANEPPLWENKLYVQQGAPRRLGMSISYMF